jgi:opacity protein-like surface antigen
MMGRSVNLRLVFFGMVLLTSASAQSADLPSPGAGVSGPPLAVGPDWRRFYVSLRGGGAFLQDTSIDYVNGALPSRSLSFNPGWAVLGAVGWQATPWFRTELELGERSNGISNIAPGSGPSGSAAATTLMVNGYIDIPNRTPVTPFVGGGFGKAWLSHALTVDGGTLTDGSQTTWPWAYQFMGGARLAIAPKWDVSLEYRYLATQRALFQDTQGLFYNANYNSHAVLLGVTWSPW